MSASQPHGQHQDEQQTDGVPIKLFAKIKAAGQNTGDLQISNNEIKIKNGNKWTQFENIFDQQTREKDIYDSDLQKIVPLVLDGYCVTLFVFGTESSDKREILNGVIQLIFDKLWNELSRQSSKSSLFKIQLSGLEIVEDIIYDLMDINNNNLIIEHGIDGPYVLNLQKSILTSGNDFSILFNEMLENRTKQLTEFGTKSSKSSFFLKLEINNNNKNSFLQFVEFPAADKLIENPAQLRMKEGVSLNKELIGISNLINSFNDKLLETPYQDCKSNLLLQDAFGGNCITFGIVIFNVSNSFLINKILLNYSNIILENIENYPVINNKRIRGLLIKYHKRYNHILRQLQSIKKQNINNIQYENIEAKLLEFRTLLIEKEKELIALHGDKDKLRESYGQFRKKYGELVEKKTKLQKDLILSEEKCLNISKTLIDLQIENNDLKKNESTIRAELETKLIGAENDILETGMREENLSKDIIKLRKEREELLQEKKTLSIEYVALRSNYMDLNCQYDEQKEEQQQLNVQLINLINANKALESTSSKLSEENEILFSKNESLLNNKQEIENKYKDYELEMMKIKTLCDKQAIELVKGEVEISRMKTEIEATKSEYSKKWLKLSKEKEIELQNITNQRTNESQHNRAQTQQLQRENDTLKGQIRIANRQIINQQQKTKQYQQEIFDKDKELINLRDLLKEKIEQYRDKLLTYLNRVDINMDDNNDHDNIEIEDLKTTQKKLYQELIDQHKMRENELMDDSENQRKKNRKLQQNLHTINSKFLLLQDFVKDISPDTEIPSNININKLFDDNNDINDIEQYSEKLKSKIMSLERELEKEKRAHVNTAERAQTQQEGIQKELLSLKKILREEHSDCDPMSHKIKIEYQENLTKLKALQLTLQQQMDHNLNTQKQMETMHQNALKLTNQQNDNFKQKINILQQEINSLQNENQTLKQQQQQLQQQRKLSSSKLLKRKSSIKKPSSRQRKSSMHNIDASLNVAGPSSDIVADGGQAINDVDIEKYENQIYNLKKKYKENDSKYKKKIQELQNKISELESMSGGGDVGGGDAAIAGDGNVAWERVRKLEKEKAELIGKCKSLESELSTMESHYKKEIQKYKKLIAKLKK